MKRKGKYNRVWKRLAKSKWAPLPKRELYPVLTSSISDKAFRLWICLRFMMLDFDDDPGNRITKVTMEELSEALHWSKSDVGRIFEELYEAGFPGLVICRGRGKYEIYDLGVNGVEPEGK
ncbi:MAG: hypothetical protein UT08_C0013G0009 [Candidatus Woesebacteria bacterium GW2011_GWB1_38_8]|uniref:Uncharacterized protein n=1 Tax=Candidatus Woesebacteria bacterium GW2011_GWB1_38_8 TaxID=1618570 RepID=A0A0G0L1J8_9BACT|nr:MAG: hypothetical protein UT08_C0013G0009 [Candidatus Woesebacteria bacterium GW2011_GWB1_38_8]